MGPPRLQDGQVGRFARSRDPSGRRGRARGRPRWSPSAPPAPRNVGGWVAAGLVDQRGGPHRAQDVEGVRKLSPRRRCRDRRDPGGEQLPGTRAMPQPSFRLDTGSAPRTYRSWKGPGYLAVGQFHGVAAGRRARRTPSVSSSSTGRLPCASTTVATLPRPRSPRLDVQQRPVLTGQRRRSRRAARGRASGLCAEDHRTGARRRGGTRRQVGRRHARRSPYGRPSGGPGTSMKVGPASSRQPAARAACSAASWTSTCSGPW